MTQAYRIALACALALVATGCELPHGHDHAEPHEQGAEHGHGGLVAHGHDPEAIAVTHFTDRTELFVEYPPLGGR